MQTEISSNQHGKQRRVFNFLECLHWVSDRARLGDGALQVKNAGILAQGRELYWHLCECGESEFVEE